MENIIKRLVKNRIIVLFFCVVVAVYGLYSYYVIPKQENPDVTVPVALIQTVYPGASASDVDTYITSKIEREISELADVDTFSSSSFNSVSLITVYFVDDKTIDELTPDLRQAVDGIVPDLPEQASEPVIYDDLVEKNQFIYALSSEVYSVAELTEFAQSMSDSLLEVDGVVSVDIGGSRDRQVVVQADYERLELYNISIDTLLQILQAQNLSIPSGSLEYESGRIGVVAPGVFESLEDIENVIIGGASEGVGFVRVSDVADVFFETVNNFYYLENGSEAILLTGTFAEGINPINIGTELVRQKDLAVAELPQEVQFTEIMYSPGDVERSVNDFIASLLQSVLLIVVVVMIGVHLRNGVIVSAAIPLTILITFIVMNILRIEFHFISIAALIISLGILVDNAIVVSEAIQQNLNDGKERLWAVIAGVRQTAVPMFTSTVTTIVSFSIIYLVPGSIGAVASTIPTVVITSLVASYAIAMFVTPVLAYIFFRPESQKRAEAVSPLKRLFLLLLKLALRFKAACLVLAMSTLVIAALLLLNVGIKFFPFADKPVVYVNVTGEAYSIDRTGELVREAGELLAEHPLVQSVTSSVGKGLPSFFLTAPSLPEADNVGQLLLQLDEEQLERYDGIEEAVRELQTLLSGNITGGLLTVKPLEYSMPTDAPITMTLTSDDTAALTEAAALLRGALENTPGTDDVRDDEVAAEFQYEVVPDSDMLALYGLTKYDVLRQINYSVMGANASTFLRDGQEYDIVVRSDANTLDKLKQLPLKSTVGDINTTLDEVAEFKLSGSVQEVRKYNGDRYINVLSGVLPGYSAGTLEGAALDQVADDIEALGVQVLSRGEFSNMMDLIGNLGVTASGAIVVIYLVLLLQFNSFKKPFVILASIPLSLIGCLFGLFALGMDIQAMSILGLVTLIGIVVNNGIILVEFMENNRAEGMAVEQACIEAVNQRYRPIMMSSVTTCIGLVPLIVAGDPMTAPMASVLLFGLLFSTVLTMVVVPVLYTFTQRGKV